MAYGDLKVRNLIWNTGSGDNTVVLSTLATTSSPTFTGTVTVPTPTAGDNSTKAASTAFVVASFAPKASPAFTGTATGVNLTLSGDLTVNGTTTTINTTTLQVEDKNIEIGKVSSPSDTTADGGGWTLKGATDKTFNWVNSTDAWTSSEHIALASGKSFQGNLTGNVTGNASGSAATVTGAAQAAITSVGTLTGLTVSGNTTISGNYLDIQDTKKLRLGTDGDCQFYHSGGANFIETGSQIIHIQSDSSIRLQKNTGNENMLVANAGGSVDLYHNNSKKIETTATGVTVTGTVSDSIGDVRKLGYTSTSSAYTLLQSDNGKFIEMGGGGVTAPSGMAAGTMITIVNVASADQTITQGSNFTLTNAADASTGNRTLASKGMATILFLGSAQGSITGAGLS
tara:strand:+ start:9834 stop:11030 length:1197 start_codon:yes stop_codon:yes gene_type:complete